MANLTMADLTLAAELEAEELKAKRAAQDALPTGISLKATKAIYHIASVNFNEMFGAEIVSAIDKTVELVTAKGAKIAAKRQAIQALKTKILSLTDLALGAWQPSALRSQDLRRATLYQCGLTVAAEATDTDPASTFVQFTLNPWKRLKPLLITFNGQYGLIDTTPDVAAIAERLWQLTLERGVVIDGHHYVAVASSPSQQKSGTAIGAEKSWWASAHELFFDGGVIPKDRVSNGSEELKRTALFLTPISPNKAPSPLRVDEICILPGMQKTFTLPEALVVAEDGKEDVSLQRNVHTERELWDGALFVLDDDAWMGPCAQFRTPNPTALKGNAVIALSVVENLRQAGFPMDKPVVDIDGRRWALPWQPNPENLPVARALGTDSIVKSSSLGGKHGLTWTERVAHAVALQESGLLPHGAELWVVREVDIPEELERRRAGRQLLQQFLFANNKEMKEAAEYICKPTFNRLAERRNAVSALVELAELEAPEATRSQLARLVANHPALALTKAAEHAIFAKQARTLTNLAAGKAPLKGLYPYITEDPVAFFQVYLCGIDINDSRIGYLKAGEVSISGYTDSEELLVCRYPANWLATHIVTNRRYTAYGSMNGVLVLNVHDAGLIVMDGDVDGDEAFVTADQFYVNLAKRSRQVSIMGSSATPIAVFPHGKAYKQNKDEEAHPEVRGLLADAHHLAAETAKALVRSQQFNAVGLNSNGAAAYMAAAASEMARGDEANTIRIERMLMKAMWCHIGAILAIDMVKTGQIDAFIKRHLDAVTGRNAPPMPYAQRANKEEAFDSRISSLAALADGSDKAADIWAKLLKGGLVSELGKYRCLVDEVATLVDQELVKWHYGQAGIDLTKLNIDPLQGVLFAGVKPMRTTVILRKEFSNFLKRKDFTVVEDRNVMEKMNQGKIGLIDLLNFMFNEQGNYVYKVGTAADSRDDRLNTLVDLFGQMVISSLAAMGRTEEDIKSHINYYVEDAFRKAEKFSSEAIDVGGVVRINEEGRTKAGEYAFFILKMFARYINDPSEITKVCASTADEILPKKQDFVYELELTDEELAAEFEEFEICCDEPPEGWE